MSSPIQPTVPVTCPSCQHAGPAYVFLLGKRSRCKMCRQVFQMPGHVRIPCPRCQASLRVPAEMIDCEVACKFCNHAFRARPAQVLVRESPSTELVLDDSILDHSHYAVTSNFETKLQTVQTAFDRFEQGRQQQSERILALERALVELLSEQEELQVDLRRLRTAYETLARQRYDESQKLQALLSQLKKVQKAAARAPERPHSLAHEAHSSSRPKATAPTHIPSKPRGHSRALREVIDRLTNCTWKTEELVTQMQTIRQERQHERGAFKSMLEDLRDEHSRAKTELDAIGATSDLAPKRDLDLGEEYGGLPADSTMAEGSTR